MLRRRHHCRKCGRVFCHACAPRAWVRVCCDCKVSVPSAQLLAQLLAPLCRVLQNEPMVPEVPLKQADLSGAEVGARMLQRKLHCDAAEALLSPRSASQTTMRAEYLIPRIAWYWNHRKSAVAFESWSNRVRTKRQDERLKQNLSEQKRVTCSDDDDDGAVSIDYATRASPHRWVHMLHDGDNNPPTANDGRNEAATCFDNDARRSVNASLSAQVAAVPPELPPTALFGRGAGADAQEGHVLMVHAATQVLQDVTHEPGDLNESHADLCSRCQRLEGELADERNRARSMALEVEGAKTREKEWQRKMAELEAELAGERAKVSRMSAELEKERERRRREEEQEGAAPDAQRAEMQAELGAARQPRRQELAEAPPALGSLQAPAEERRAAGPPAPAGWKPEDGVASELGQDSISGNGGRDMEGAELMARLREKEIFLRCV